MLRDDDSLSEVRSPKTGDIGRMVDGTRWMVPSNIEVKNERLYWAPYGNERAAASKGMLEAFCKLADAKEKSIRDFARRYGVLGICEHGLPFSHNPSSRWPEFHRSMMLRKVNHPERAKVCRVVLSMKVRIELLKREPGWLPGNDAAQSFQRTPPCYPLDWENEDGHPWEPLESWREFAREAFSLLRLADSLLRNNVGRPEDWAALYARSGLEAPWWSQSVTRDRQYLATAVNDWLVMGDVRPRAAWNFSDERPSVRLGGHGLFGALALQLALATGQSGGFAICHHCRKEYVPTVRRPKVGQRHFCKECREIGIPNRYSLADYRRKFRGAKTVGTTK